MIQCLCLGAGQGGYETMSLSRCRARRLLYNVSVSVQGKEVMIQCLCLGAGQGGYETMSLSRCRARRL